MEYYFNLFSSFSHQFAGQFLQSLLPALAIAIITTLVFYWIKNINSAARYKLWVVVFTMILVLPLTLDFLRIDMDLSKFFTKADTPLEPMNNDILLVSQYDYELAPPADNSRDGFIAGHTFEPQVNVESSPNNGNYSGAITKPGNFAAESGKYDLARVLELIPSALPMIAIVVWLFISTLLLFRVLFAFRSFRALKQTALEFSERDKSRISQLLANAPFKRPMRILQSDKINIPVSTGFFHPTILLPVGLIDDLADNELKSILVHEAAHLERRDDWMKLFQRILTALFFINPIILWVSRRLNLEREMACDEFVLEQTGQPKVYANCLAKIIQKNITPVEPTLVTGAILPKKHIFRRIEMILGRKNSSKPVSSGRLAALIVLIITFTLVTIYISPAFAWPYQPFKYAVIAEVVKEKADSSTETIFSTEKDDRWKSNRREAPYNYYYNTDGVYDLSSSDYFDAREIYERLREAEKALQSVRIPPVVIPEVNIPDIVYAPVDVDVPDLVVVPDNYQPDHGLLRIGDNYIAYVPDGDDDVVYIEADDLSEEERIRLENRLEELEKDELNDYWRDKEIDQKYLSREQLKAYQNYSDAADTQSKYRSERARAQYEEALAYAEASYDRTGNRGIGSSVPRVFAGTASSYINNLSGDDYLRINNDDDGNVTYDWKRGSHRIMVEVGGEIEINDEGTDIVSMSRRAYMNIYDKDGRIRRELEIEADDDGKPEYFYRYRGKKAEFDGDAREWFEEILIDCIRITGFNAESRVNKIYADDGLDGVLQEIDNIDSDYITRLYLYHLLENHDLSDDDLGEIIQYITLDIDSDYEKAEILLIIAEQQENEDRLLKAFVRAVKSIDSDYERRKVLSELSFGPDVSTGVLIDVLDIAESMSSDYERSQLLSDMLELERDDPEFNQAFMDAIAAIDSDYERSKVILGFFRNGTTDGKIAAEVLELIGDMSSDYEKAKLLIYIAGRSPRNQDLFDAYIPVLHSMSSNYEIRRAITALGPFYDLDDASLEQVIGITDNISSNYEKAQLLQDMAGEINRSETIRRAMLLAVEDISSGYEASRVLSEILEEIDYKDEDAVRDVLISIESISSDHERAAIIDDLIPHCRGNDNLEDDLIDIIETIDSEYERDKLYSDLYRHKRDKR